MSLKGTIFEPMFGESSPVDELLDEFDELVQEGKPEAVAKILMEERVVQRAERKKRLESFISDLMDLYDAPRTTVRRYVNRTIENVKDHGKDRALIIIDGFEDIVMRLIAKLFIAVKDQEDLAADRLLNKLGRTENNDGWFKVQRVRTTFEFLKKWIQ